MLEKQSLIIISKLLYTGVLYTIKKPFYEMYLTEL
jgi:hypothetical protein